MKFGRLPRQYDDRIPKFSALMAAQSKAGVALPAVPPAVDYSVGLPADLGMMLNDTLGDCTCAAAGHAIQVWSSAAQQRMVTPSDEQIEVLYEQAGGYIPGDPQSDQGAIIQVVLKDWMAKGLDLDELAAFVEVEVSDVASVKRAIFECGLCYIGFNVPGYMPEDAGSTWDVQKTGDQQIIGGHCVILVGYSNLTGLYKLISWGSIYYMTPAFFAKYVDEAYALANPEWIEATGKSPAGLGLERLEQLMSAMVGGTGKWADSHRKKKHRRQHIRRLKAAALARGAV
jgi:hypothetical protein